MAATLNVVARLHHARVLNSIAGPKTMLRVCSQGEESADTNAVIGTGSGNKNGAVTLKSEPADLVAVERGAAVAALVSRGVVHSQQGNPEPGNRRFGAVLSIPVASAAPEHEASRN